MMEGATNGFKVALRGVPRPSEGIRDVMARPARPGVESHFIGNARVDSCSYGDARPSRRGIMHLFRVARTIANLVFPFVHASLGRESCALAVLEAVRAWSRDGSGAWPEGADADVPVETRAVAQACGVAGIVAGSSGNEEERPADDLHHAEARAGSAGSVAKLSRVRAVETVGMRKRCSYSTA